MLQLPFLLDNSKGQAFANISPLLNETKVSEIHSVSSIYDENKNDIVQQKWLLFQKIVSLIISIISSTIFLSFLFGLTINQIFIK